MSIKVFNSLTNKKEEFVPLRPNSVSIYICGPTVYNDPHLGNFRPPVVFDLLRRLFIYEGYEVDFVSNFTDVDDKIIKKALEEKKTEKEITDYYINEFKNVLSSLNVLPATANPRVTETMSEIIDYIDNLVKTGHAYVKGNDVYFRVNSVSNYGILSNIKLEDLRAGARIEENELKENPFDFTLWKKTNEGITWDSPWGKGRPGWHTECCVMINTRFGNIIDIHGGGFDLKFPHHENEIAQSEATANTTLARYWMHNGFLNVNNEKMSKSLGNFITGKAFIKEHGGLFTRYVLLSTYYRAPINLNDEFLATCKVEIDKIGKAINDLAKELQVKKIFKELGKEEISEFISCLEDDLNISNALSVIFKMCKDINLALRNKSTKNEELLNLYASLSLMLEILGLKFDIITLSVDDLSLLEAYNKAKESKDFALSDCLRAKAIERKLL
ncbi:MAG: cysteine--tRNA ligase [Bacilli bacterium]